MYEKWCIQHNLALTDILMKTNVILTHKLFNQKMFLGNLARFFCTFTYISLYCDEFLEEFFFLESFQNLINFLFGINKQIYKLSVCLQNEKFPQKHIKQVGKKGKIFFFVFLP